MGTDGYIAPEHLEGQPTFQSDIYSVGMIGIQVLTGKHPAHLPEDSATSARVWRYAAPGQAIEEIDERLAAILDKMIHPHSSERYVAVSDVLSDFQTLKAARHQEEEERQAKILQEEEECQAKLKQQQEDKQQRQERQRQEAIKQEKLQEQEDRKQAETKKNEVARQRRLSIQRRNKVISVVSLGLGMFFLGVWGFISFQKKQYAQYEEVCN